jgi:hypothetical protein
MELPIEREADVRAVGDIVSEMDRQVTLWGVQSWPDGTGGDVSAHLARTAKHLCDTAKKNNHMTWLDILYEEFAECRAANSAPELREELVQLAAVCASWVRDIDTRGK